MRPLFALAVVISILGGLQLYMKSRPRPSGNANSIIETAWAGKISIEVTLTFDAGPDAFALDATKAAAVLVTFRGRDVLRVTGNVPAGQPLLITEISDVVAGRNEFFVQAIPRDGDSLVARAIRLRVLRDDVPIAERTLWSEPGLPVEGSIEVNVLESAAANDHTHE